MTSANSPPTGLLPMELPLTRSAEGSRARTSQTLASRLALRVSEAVSGPNTRASLANFDPVSSSWRTSQRCLVEGWTVYLETWPRSGMMRGGIAYQLQPLAPLTSGIGSGSLPTPRSTDGHKGQRTLAGAQRELARGKNVDLGMLVRLWPTPKASAAEPDFAKVGRSATGISLATAVQMWPTPSAADDRDRGNLSTPAIQRRMAKGKQLNLSMVVSDTSGQLNPTWVEWLMGFPTGHTDLKPLETP
jgi:hypothetical protein